MDINTPLHGFVHLWIVGIIIIIGYLIVVANKLFALNHPSNRRITNCILMLVLSLYGICFSYLCFFYRSPMNEAHFQIIPFWSYREAFENGGIVRLGVARSIFLNVLITIPLGYILPAVYRFLNHRYRLTILTILVLSLLTELIQLFSKTGLCETDDLINNTIGGLIGLIAYVMAEKMIKKVRKL